MGPTPCAPSSDRAPPRSAGPDGRAAPPCRDQTHRRTDLVRPPADPSCAPPADPYLKPTESRFASRLNESFATHSEGKRTSEIDAAMSANDPIRTSRPPD